MSLSLSEIWTQDLWVDDSYINWKNVKNEQWWSEGSWLIAWLSSNTFDLKTLLHFKQQNFRQFNHFLQIAADTLFNLLWKRIFRPVFLNVHKLINYFRELSEKKNKKTKKLRMSKINDSFSFLKWSAINMKPLLIWHLSLWEDKTNLKNGLSQ